MTPSPGSLNQANAHTLGGAARTRGDFYVDKTSRCRGNRRMCGLYGRRTASERMNSRAERLIGRNTLRGLARVGGYVEVALTLMLLIAAASYRQGRPEHARSIEHYASHLILDRNRE